jgi:hypothetical protein
MDKVRWDELEGILLTLDGKGKEEKKKALLELLDNEYERGYQAGLYAADDF